MLQPNRWWESESYRFGYNGIEKENDVTVKGGIAMADFRMYDARVGCWWGVDKIVKPSESPYAAFFNNPINFADPSGLNPRCGVPGFGPDQEMQEDMIGNVETKSPTITPPQRDKAKRRSYPIPSKRRICLPVWQGCTTVSGRCKIYRG